MSKRIGVSCLTVGAMLGALSGCSGTSGPAAASDGSVAVARSNVARVAADSVSSDDLQAAAAANDAFAVDLYAQVRQTAPNGNLLTAPITASLALTMSYAGAQGETASQMAKVLHLPNGDRAFSGQNALSQALLSRAATALAGAEINAQRAQQPAPSPDDYQLQLVNSIWAQKAYPWQSSFLDSLAANYGAGVYQVDYEQAFEPARLAINGWVSDQTSQKINDLLPSGSLDDMTRMVLVDALHLKLPWLTAFSAQQTAPGTFTRADSSTVQSAFMHALDQFAYVDDGQAQVAALPLFGGDLWLVVGLPHEGVALADYEATLSASSAPLHVPSSKALVELSLPKAAFTSQTFSLAHALGALGMTQAFDPDLANFKGLCANPPDGNLYISDVLQKTMIAIQETGVEAAAATAVIMGVGLAISPSEQPPPTPIELNVNRPYLVSIVDQQSDTLLMLGHIQDPSDAGSP